MLDTYFQFHLAFVLPPIAALAALTWYRRRPLSRPLPLAGIGIIVALALGYTTPWDNLLIEQGVWWYGDGVTWRTIWAAPVGEYLFFVLQPILTGLFLYQLSIPTDTDLGIGRRARVAGVLAGLAVGAVGVALLLAGHSWLYMGAIVAWAGPILAIQWGFGWPHLWRARRTVAIAITVPTMYLWIADWAAITQFGLWIISTEYTIGVAPFGLPIEEAAFFFATNVFVVQGLVLYVWLLDRHPSIPWAIDRERAVRGAGSLSDPADGAVEAQSWDDDPA